MRVDPDQASSTRKGSVPANLANDSGMARVTPSPRSAFSNVADTRSGKEYETWLPSTVTAMGSIGSGRSPRPTARSARPALQAPDPSSSGRIAAPDPSNRRRRPCAEFEAANAPSSAASERSAPASRTAYPESGSAAIRAGAPDGRTPATATRATIERSASRRIWRSLDSPVRMESSGAIDADTGSSFVGRVRTPIGSCCQEKIANEPA